MNTTPATAQISDQTMSVGELLSQGGWAMVPIYLCFVAVIAVFIRKLIELRCARNKHLGWVSEVISQVEQGKLADVQTTCQSSPHPAARVAEATARALSEYPAKAEAEAKRVGSLELQKMETNLNTLSFLAQVAPLLGLLGTVLGMVDLFLSLQGSAQANLSVAELSSGIWKALLTTAAGLTVAVPALASHSYLSSRTDRVRLQFVDLVQRMLYAYNPQPGEGASDGL